MKPLAPKTTANLEQPKNSLEILAGNRKPVARPTMGVLPSEMANKGKIKMDIFEDVAEEEDEDIFFAKPTSNAGLKLKAGIAAVAATEYMKPPVPTDENASLPASHVK